MSDNDDNQSVDDALEPTEDFQATQPQPLAEDNDPPAAPADDQPASIPPDHPLTDAELDAQEVYDEGVASATDIDAQDETHTKHF
jgi:hypothetical protein